ncbi:MAG: hypothetical protein ABI824_02330 [Acidobacteriota bacterium]
MRRIALIVLLSITTVSAADKDKARFAPQPAASYPGHQTTEKITIAAVPYNTDALAATVFDKAKPHQLGILPVLLIIQNDTGKAIRVDLKTEFVTSAGDHLEPMSPESVRYFQGVQSRPDMPGPQRIPIPLKKAKKGPLNTPEIDGRAWAVKLIPPGESANGFVYFRVTSVDSAQLYLTGLSDAATRKPYFYFEIPLDAK